MTDIPTITQEEAVEVRARLCALLLDRDGADFDGEVHLTSAEAREVIAALSPNMDHAVGGVLERFPDGTANVHSPIILVHQLRASADIQDRQPPVNQDAVREAGRAVRVRNGTAVTITFATIEGADAFLTALATPPLDNTGLDAATVERCAQVADEELENRRAEQKRDLFCNHLRGQINAAIRIGDQIRALSTRGQA